MRKKEKKYSTFATELELSLLWKSHFTSSPHHFPCNYSLNPLNGDFILLWAAPDPARRGLVIGLFFFSPSRQKKLYEPVRSFFSFYLKLLQYPKLTLTSWGHFNPVRGCMQLPIFSCGFWAVWPVLECGNIRLEIRWNVIALIGKLRGCNSIFKRIKDVF